MGWTLEQVDLALSDIERADDDLAMVELEITNTRDSVIACHARRPHTVAACTEQERGRGTRRFRARLSDSPFGGALSVARV